MMLSKSWMSLISAPPHLFDVGYLSRNKRGGRGGSQRGKRRIGIVGSSRKPYSLSSHSSTYTFPLCLLCVLTLR
jgi:hypothetical protein